MLFAVTKGTSAPTNINVTETGYTYEMVYSNAQTIIYDDLNGLYDGFENMLIFSKSFYGEIFSRNYRMYVNIGTLRLSDAGTYFCTVMVPYYIGNKLMAIAGFADTGGVTIQVNTKPGQAHSTRADGRNVLTYSAVLLSAAFKLLL